MGVLCLVEITATGDVLSSDGKSVDLAWRWIALLLRIVVGFGDPTFVDFLDLRRTLDLLRVLSRACKGRQEDAEQKGDDRHDNEQFDERECATV